MTRKCYIMSGVSGSGKSTYIKKLVEKYGWSSREYAIVSADHYFQNEDTGEYKFDPAELGAAHKQCLKKFLFNMAYVLNEAIFVDNTNIEPTEIAPYYAIAEAHDYDVEIITLQCSPEVAAKRNLHQVPLKTIQFKVHALLNRKLPKRWKETIIPFAG